ncbi:PREDICTED: fatty acyl-CoA reductase 1-like isoform X2 [Papilio polytes]|uniref:fatty acyl-CoA reductase 1-like isoform X2 n=1 Tax=Papilio polytes TaxID=76194 RepID=UPI00067636BA|nr:PREDICTED: fatty acyl-CoA reductase 1-like isoform X2 [Papilio polytes]
MDPIVALEQNAIDRQKPMIDSLAHGDSDVQAFYRQKTIFVTGGTGFLGKLLIEKLFRTCDLKRVYLLIRSKMNCSPVERLSDITNDSIFDSVRRVNPSFANNITAIEGDVCELNLGISDANWHRLAEEVDILFHIAANVRFDTSLKDVALSNVRGTREALTLGKACRNLKSFVFLSTAFSQATCDVIGKTVSEEFGSCPITPDAFIHIAETYNTEQLNNIAPTLVKGWPNTYTFSKAISEELVRTMGADLPACVVRPAIVTPTYTEPVPGWLDKSTIYGSNGVALGILMGVLQVIQCDIKCRIELVPADMTTNATIVAASTTAAKRTTGYLQTDIYTVTSTRNPIKWKQRFKFASPKTTWFINPIPIKNSVMFTLLFWLFHYIPGYIFDGLNIITDSLNCTLKRINFCLCCNIFVSTNGI